mmetsp:Transcript_6717/g.12680  ORF Transcript_6717/g.12680 Transcript_6717/m.12680 type:complete len:210 (+) Transcript_6717:288-917(+)
MLHSLLAVPWAVMGSRWTPSLPPNRESQQPKKLLLLLQPKQSKMKKKETLNSRQQWRSRMWCCSRCTTRFGCGCRRSNKPLRSRLCRRRRRKRKRRQSGSLCRGCIPLSPPLVLSLFATPLLLPTASRWLAALPVGTSGRSSSRFWALQPAATARRLAHTPRLLPSARVAIATAATVWGAPSVYLAENLLKGLRVQALASRTANCHPSP